mmetsp:Transcript_35683/g.79255  ORF Transcript_35683/g.79255 Transcript_35683/m.79255 type:complete len:137 (-) Transcript_35683:846-1256(-)
MNWFRFPSTRATGQQQQTWEAFLHAITTLFFSGCLQLLCGTTALGVKHVSRLLYKINPTECLAGVRLGGGVVFQPLTAHQTVALQVASGISSTARMSVARSLRYWFGAPVFADERACAEIIQGQEQDQQYHTYTRH